MSGEEERLVATARIGTDEAGKGDFFGPLVIAAVWADETAESLFENLGVTDSKKLSDNRAKTLARQIVESKVPTSVVVIGPAKYNELYAKMRNLNRLLAWGHARAIENILEKTPAPLAIADQFGDESLIKNALMKHGKAIELHQMHRGESEPVVAAASILARAEFLRKLSQLGSQIGVVLPKGAGSPVDTAGAQILRRGGMDLLATVAKCHFKNTQKARKLVVAR
ncbi:MAG: hypothetical protein Kow0074_07330 [Candidatus Zixiibacteriota bacterium]